MGTIIWRSKIRSTQKCTTCIFDSFTNTIWKGTKMVTGLHWIIILFIFTFTGIPRTASFIERSPRGSNTSTQDIACVYEISPSPPVGPPPKLPSPKRSLLRATSSQDSVGLRATQSDSSILSSSSDKSADLRHKVSAAWLDGVTAEGGDASVTSQSPKRPSSSPTSSQLRRSSVRLSAKNSLDGVCLGTGGSAEKKWTKFLNKNVSIEIILPILWEP